MGMDTESPEAEAREAGGDLLDNLSGLLKVRVKRGLDLAVRDITDSDPYVVIKMGDQKVKTRVVKKDINPVWDEELTLAVLDANLPIKLTVYDRDVFSMDDPMGDAEFDIKPFVEAMNMPRLERHPDGTVLKRMQPSRNNCLAEESCIIWKDEKVLQHLTFRLQNVETGEVEIELRWEQL
ncbi:hypothetical protein L1887_17115 [Cichorium endivia]|nr:hypothetical protein L1887_17115 [Cichorium endivia]